MKSVYIFLLLVFLQVIHSLEEIIFHFNNWFPVVTGRAHNLTGFFPVINIDNNTFIIGNIAIILFLFLIYFLISKNTGWALKLASIIAFVEILNGAAHLTGALIFWQYYPGCVSGIGLIIVGAMYLKRKKKIRNNYV
jgi:hypothetical protein